MNLYQKIVEVRKVAEGFTKDGSSYGYSYVTGNQVLAKIKDKMNELCLLLIPSTEIGEHHTHAYKTAKGKDALDFVVKGKMSYTWINGDEPSEREVISWAYYGQQDDISKAFGSALTYSERYFLLKCLGLPTDEDDPDAKKDKHGNQNPNASQGSNNRPNNQSTQTTNQQSQQPSSQGGASDVKLASEAQVKMLRAKMSAARFQDLTPVNSFLSLSLTSITELPMARVNELIKYLDDNRISA